MAQLIKGVVDTQKNSYRSIGQVNAADDLELELEVKMNGQPIEFINPECELLIKKSDNNRIRQTKDILYQDGKFKIKVDEQGVTYPGIVTCQLLTREDGRVSTCLFYFNVGTSLDREVLQSISKVEVLEELDEYVATAFANLDEYEKRIISADETIRKLNDDMNEAEKIRGASELERQETFKDLKENMNATISNLESSINLSNLNEKERSEVFNSLKSDLESIKQDLNTLNTNITLEEGKRVQAEINRVNKALEIIEKLESTNNSVATAEAERVTVFNDIKSELTSLKEALTTINNTANSNEEVRKENEVGRVAAEQQRQDNFNSMKLENDNFKKGINEQYEDIVTEFDKVIANVTNGNENATNSEIVQARGKEVNLNARLDNFDEQLDKNTNLINNYSLALSQYNVFEPPIASDEWKTEASGRILNMTSKEFLEKFYDIYVGSNNGYTVIKNLLGKDQSGAYDIYEYVFTPENYTKTILLSSGMHPWELPAMFGLAHFIKHLMTTPYMHEGFKYIKENVRIKIIPIVNPWGFNQYPKEYVNVNGININRNFDSNGRWDTFPTDGDYFNRKGSTPFSEAETIILRDWAIENKNSEFWIDCHTGMNNPHVNNWVYYMSMDPLRDKVLSALDKLEKRIKVKYDIEEPTKIVDVDNPGSLRQWYSVETLGLSSVTVEISNGWGTDINNESEDITEYEVALTGYIFEFLDINSNSFKEFIRSCDNYIKDLKIQLTNKIDNNEMTILKNLDIVAFDRFDRVDSPYIKTAETGQIWSTEYGNYKIEAGKAKGTDITVVDVGVTDYSVSADIEFNSYAGLVFRFKDELTYYTTRINSTGINIQKVFGGSITILNNYSFTPTIGTTYNIKVVANGERIILYLDNRKILEAKDSSLLTQTKVGLRTVNDTVTSFDNFIVKKVYDIDIEETNLTDTVSLTLLNGYTGTLEYTKLNGGLVSIKGNITVGTAGNNTAIATLPEGVRPAVGGHSFPCHIADTTQSYLGLFMLV